MKNHFRKIFNRILWTVLLILIQVIWFTLFFWKFATYSTPITIGLTIFSVAMVIYLVSKDDNPAYRMGWIVFIMIFPVAGGLFYLSFGDKKPSKKMRRKLSLEHYELRGYIPQSEKTFKELKEKDMRASMTSRYIMEYSHYPVCKHTKTKYYKAGEYMVDDIIEAIQSAQKYIFLEYFIIQEGVMWNRILEELVKKAEAGVEVRIIYDDIGSLGTLPPQYYVSLENMSRNIHCMAFNPFVPMFSLVMNNRDHRKILIVDGTIAFNGGINLSDEYINEVTRFGYWKDTAVRLEGEAVWNFTIMFLETWRAYRKDKYEIEYFMPEYEQMHIEANGFVQPFCDTPLEREPLAENVYIEILNQAKHYVYIYTPYLIIDNEMKIALCLAAKRGVDVRIVTPGIPDKKIIYRLTRSNYAPLVRAGVKIYEYTPGFIHAKSYVCDDKFAIVGTINMDYRSLYLHFECGTYMYDTDIIKEIRNDCIETFKQSHRIDLKNRKHSFIGYLFDAILRLLAPIL